MTATMMKLLATAFFLGWLITMATFVLDGVIDEEILGKIRATCIATVFSLGAFFLTVIVWAQ